MSKELRYPAFLLNQTPESQPLVMFAAKATDIDLWAGVPQRRRLDGEETVGWQREENEGRLKELTSFFSDGRNVVQNPLLCALQSADSVSFEAGTDNPAFGTLVIRVTDYEDLPLSAVLREVADRLAARVTGLSDVAIDPQRLKVAIDRARNTHSLSLAEPMLEQATDNELLDEPSDTPEEDEAVGDVASAVFAEETQLVDFYQELLIRIEILALLGERAPEPDVLLGFDRESMLSYLKPVVLVDGQHRLRGAVLAARSRLNSSEGQAAQMDAVDAGSSAEAVREQMLEEFARRLPVSLLMDPSPSEHVFQFVVVNQRATPMGRALLGTIVSTSLSREELDIVAERLRDAGIPLDDSQAVAYMTRAPESPFAGLVQTGVGGDITGHLQWTVLKSLTGIFRELRGGKLYGGNNDYAAIWGDKYLLASSFVSDAETVSDAKQIWSAADGPWRLVFSRFYSLVRDRFSDDDPSAPNFWGNTESNIFNKIYLTIMAADYFQFLVERRLSISSVEEVEQTVGEWLFETKATYFARNWKMDGLKKDQKPVREAWAKAWSEYRKDPSRIPPVTRFRPS